MLKLLWKLYKDERGIDPVTVGLIAAGGGALAGGLFGKNKQKTEVYDPYAAEREQLRKYLSGKLGTSTPYSYNEAFNLDQPEVEAETEKAILGGLRNLPTKRSDIQAIYGRYGEARKASAREQQAEEMKKTQNMYNRLGLVSSTPGLTAQTELGRRHGLDLDLIESEIAAGGVGAEMDAERLYQDIANQYMTQGQLLGGRQRGYQQYGQQMSMEDIQRRLAEEQGWSQQLQGLIGQPTTIMSSEPNTWSKIGAAGMDIGTMLMMQGMGGGTRTLGARGGQTSTQALQGNRFMPRGFYR